MWCCVVPGERILTAPYEERVSDWWEMNVMYIDGTLYLEEHLSADRLLKKYVSASSPSSHPPPHSSPLR